MKQLTLALISLLLSLPIHAQEEDQLKKENPWLGMKVGVYGGPVYSNMRSHQEFLVGDFVWRSNFGMLFQLDVSKLIAFEFDVDVISKGYHRADSAYDNFFNYIGKRETETRLTYLSLPVLIKFNLRKKGGIYLSAGGHISFQLSSLRTVKVIGTIPEDYQEKGYQQHRIDAGLIGGIGGEIPAGKYQLGIEARYNLGFLPVSSETGLAFQHHQSISLLLGLKYKRPYVKRTYKGVGDL